MKPYHVLYGKKYYTPACWLKSGEKQFMGPKIIHQTVHNLKVIKERMLSTQNRQKSYEDKKWKLITFKVGDQVFLKVTPWKGLIIFGKLGKLSPRFIGLFQSSSENWQPTEQTGVANCT